MQATRPTVSFAEIERAAKVVAEHLPPTPMWSYPTLDAAVGVTVQVKHENVQPTGAFKVRGGLYLLATLPADVATRGIVTYSTGNHAQSMAYACRLRGTACTVVMPEAASPGKVHAVEALGATVVLRGKNLGGCEAVAGGIAQDTGAHLVTPGDEPALIAGVASCYVEVFRARPTLPVLVVPVGSGTGAAAACLVAQEMAPACRIVGVQSSASPASHDSWQAGEPVHRPNETRVEGLATGRGYAVPQALLRGRLAGFHLVDDEQIAAARRLLATAAHTLAEGAGATALAAVVAYPQLRAAGEVGVVCTGGNASPAELATLTAPAG